MAHMPDVPGVVKCALQWNDGIAEWGSRFFVTGYVTSPSVSDLHAAATDMSGTWATHLAPVTATDYTLNKIVLTDLVSASGAQGIWTGTQAGTDGGLSLPSNISMDLEFLTDLRYRGGKPLMHHPPATADALASARQWSPTAVSTFTGAVSDFFVGVTAISEGAFAGMAHCWLHGYRVTPPIGGVVVETVRGYQARQYVGTMRRRARKPR